MSVSNIDVSQLETIRAFGGFLKMKLIAFHDERVETVELDQIQESLDIGIPHARLKPHVTAAVLIHVAVIAVSLRQISRLNQETVVVSFQIPVLAGIYVINQRLGPIGQTQRHASAQNIVQISLSAV